MATTVAQPRLGWTTERATARSWDAADILVLVVPSLLAFEVTIGGRLFLPEILLLVLLPVLFSEARRRGVSRVPHAVIGLALIWLAAQVSSDLLNVTPAADFTRGWSKVVFLVINLSALALLVDQRWRRLELFAVGLAAGGVLQFLVTPGVLVEIDPWKFGIGYPVTLVGVIVASRPSIARNVLLPPSIFFTLALVNLALDFRSLAGICFLAGLVTIIAARRGDFRIRPRSDRRRIVIVACISAIAGIAFIQLYSYSASNGWLGTKAEKKYDQQQSELGVLLSGRPEALVSLRAIGDSPLIGHGSWAQNPKYARELATILRRASYTGSIPVATTGPAYIPTHSYLFGAWVEAGLFGIGVWIWALLVSGLILLRLHWLAVWHVPLVAFVGVAFLWDVLFSPFAAEARLIVPFYIVTLYLASLEIRRNRESNEHRSAAPA